MFTGIVTAIGVIRAMEADGQGMRLSIGRQSGALDLAQCAEGDSISVSGACLTMLQPDAQGFAADVSSETLSATTLGKKRPGDRVNLELAMRASDRLGGHLVSGHVDAAVALKTIREDGQARHLAFELPESLARYVSRKGSVCLDGVSLTVNEVRADAFEVCVIPHTLEATTLGALEVGDPVNFEVDMVARYLERLVQK